MRTRTCLAALLVFALGATTALAQTAPLDRTVLPIPEPNVAPTTVFAETVTVQSPVPPHAPLQPAKMEPEAGATARLTTPPLATGSEQSVSQLMPRPETVPVPEPALLTVRV